MLLEMVDDVDALVAEAGWSMFRFVQYFGLLGGGGRCGLEVLILVWAVWLFMV